LDFFLVKNLPSNPFKQPSDLKEKFPLISIFKPQMRNYFLDKVTSKMAIMVLENVFEVLGRVLGCSSK